MIVFTEHRAIQRLCYVTYLLLSFPIHKLLLFHDFDLYPLIQIMLCRACRTVNKYKLMGRHDSVLSSLLLRQVVLSKPMLYYTTEYQWLRKPLFPICLSYSYKCTKFGYLILRKIFKAVATRWQIFRLKCTKFVLCWGSAYSAPPDP